MYQISRAIPEVEQRLAEKLNACGMTRGDAKYLDFIHMDLHDDSYSYDHKYYDVATGFTTIFDASTTTQITSKHLLCKNLPQWVAQSWPLEEFQWGGFTVILRPSAIGMFGGRDIKIVNSAEELLEARRFYSKLAETYAKRRRAFNVVVSRYIAHPMLFHGKKMHLRMYLLCIYDGKNVKSLLAPFGKILTAREEYSLSDFNNPDIHDTHMDSTSADYYYPEDFPEAEILAPLFSQLAASIAPLTTSMRTYPSSFAGCQYFGLDIMIDSMRPVLIEVNDKVGLSVKTDPRFYSRFVDWLWNEISPYVSRRKYSACLGEKMGVAVYPWVPDSAGVSGGVADSVELLRDYPVAILYSPNWVDFPAWVSRIEANLDIGNFRKTSREWFGEPPWIVRPEGSKDILTESHGTILEGLQRKLAAAKVLGVDFSWNIFPSDGRVLRSESVFVWRGLEETFADPLNQVSSILLRHCRAEKYTFDVFTIDYDAVGVFRVSRECRDDNWLGQMIAAHLLSFNI